MVAMPASVCSIIPTSVKFLSVDVYGSADIYKTLEPVQLSDDREMDTAQEFYFVRSPGRSLVGGDKVKVLIERVANQFWMTIGINKYKKID